MVMVMKEQTSKQTSKTNILRFHSQISPVNVRYPSLQNIEKYFESHV